MASLQIADKLIVEFSVLIQSFQRPTAIPTFGRPSLPQMRNRSSNRISKKGDVSDRPIEQLPGTVGEMPGYVFEVIPLLLVQHSQDLDGQVRQATLPERVVGMLAGDAA